MNSQRSSEEVRFDLEERLLESAVRVIGATEKINPTDAGRYLSDQWLRSGPYGNHGEADEPVRIFAKSLPTAEKNQERSLER